MKKSQLNRKTKPELVEICQQMGLATDGRKEDLISAIINHKSVEVVHMSNQNVKKIALISDIHVRALDRHAEYQVVFDRTVEDIRAANVDLVVIAGDIFEEKEGLRTESIQLIRRFLLALSQVCHTFTIAGNHDLLENNPDRKPQLNAVFDHFSNDRIIYAETSGVYIMGGVALVVSSLVDGKFISADDATASIDTWLANQLVGDQTPAKMTTIAVYHGCVTGLDASGISTRFRTPAEFDGFDYVLLGDIHKHQFVRPNMVYPGSLIQQNHGESVQHGYVLMELPAGEFQFRPIANDWSFITIDVVDDLYELPNMTPYVNVRIRLADSCKDPSAIVERIRAEVSVVAKIGSFQPVITPTNAEIRPEIITEDPRDLIRSELAAAAGDEFDKIAELHDELIADIPVVDIIGSDWKIRKLSFKNIGIYGGDHLNVINFDSLGKVSGIISPNATGKSSIIYIVMYALFNGYKGLFDIKDIRNNQSMNMFVECELELGGDILRITKTCTGNKFRQTINVEKYTNGGWTVLNEVNTIKTTAKLKNLLNGDHFAAKNILSGKIPTSIFTMQPAAASTFLSKIFGLDIYAELESATVARIRNVSRDHDSLKKFCDDFGAKVRDVPIVDLQSEKKLLETQMEELDAQIAADEAQLDDSRARLAECSRDIQKYASVQAVVPGIEAELQSLILQTNAERIPDDELEALQLESTKISLELENTSPVSTKYAAVDVANARLTAAMAEKEAAGTHLADLRRQIKDNSESITKLKSTLPHIPPSWLVWENEPPEEIGIHVECGPHTTEEMTKICDMFKYTGVGNAPPKYTPPEPLLQQKAELVKLTEGLSGDVSRLRAQISSMTVPPGHVINIDHDYFEKTLVESPQPLLQVPRQHRVGILEAEAELAQIQSIIGSADYNIDELVKTISTARTLSATLKERIIEVIKSQQKMIEEFPKLERRAFLEAAIKHEQDRQEIIARNNEITDANLKLTTLKQNIIHTQFVEKRREIHTKIDSILNMLAEKNKQIATLDSQIAAVYAYAREELRKKHILEIQANYTTFCEKLEIRNKIMNAVQLLDEKSRECLVEIQVCNISIEKLAVEIAELQQETKNHQLVAARNELLARKEALSEIIDAQNNLRRRDRLQEIFDACKTAGIQYDDARHQMDDCARIHDELCATINVLEARLKDAGMQRSAKQYKITSIGLVIERYLADKNTLDTSLETLREHAENLRRLELYRSLVATKNIPTRILNRKVQLITQYVNGVLTKFIPYRLDYHSASGVSGGVTFITRDLSGRPFPIGMLSGYQTFVLNIIMKSALSHISVGSRSHLFFIDEGLDCFDKVNLERVRDLLDYISRDHSQIFLISHLPEIHKFIDQKLVIRHDSAREISTIVGFEKLN